MTVPITLVCAGNRRKEQNVVQKSLGFNWGAGGLSTALFTGVYLADVLDYVRPSRKAKHVIFEGRDKLPKGPYGTRYVDVVNHLSVVDPPIVFVSQRIGWARDPQKKMMLSWAMNGLPYDHYFQVREPS